MLLRNHTPFPALAFTSHTTHDEPFDVVVARMTLTLAPGGALKLCPTQTPLVTAETFWGDAGASSVRHESDLAPCKPFSDIVVVGTARAPHGTAAPSWEVGVRVGRKSRRLRVTGPRRWVRDGGAWKLTAPEACTEVPMRYELAYGGVARRDEREERCPTNPVGVGFARDWSLEGVDSLDAPRVESLERPFTDDPLAGGTTEGFGFYGRAWAPRLALAGTYDDAWLASQWPVLPHDFNIAYWNGAHPSLQVPFFLGGHEDIELTGFHADGPLRARLPGHTVFALLRFESGTVTTQRMIPDTLVIDVDEGRASLVWRAVLRRTEPLRVAEVRMQFVDPDAQEVRP